MSGLYCFKDLWSSHIYVYIHIFMCMCIYVIMYFDIFHWWRTSLTLVNSAVINVGTWASLQYDDLISYEKFQIFCISLLPLLCQDHKGYTNASRQTPYEFSFLCIYDSLVFLVIAIPTGEMEFIRVLICFSQMDRTWIWDLHTCWSSLCILF